MKGAEAAPLSSLHGEFGDVLRVLRDRRGLGQLYVAQELHVSAPTLSRWENGTKLPTKADVGELARALRLSDSERHILDSAWHRGVLLDLDLTSTLHVNGRGLAHVKGKLENSIDVTRELRRQGQPQLAFRIADQEADETFAMLEGNIWSDKDSPAAIELLAELYLEIVKCALDYFPRRDVRNGALAQIMKSQGDAAQASGLDRVRVFRLLAREGIEWLSDNKAIAHGIGIELAESLSNVPNRWTAEVLRANAINGGAVGDEESLVRIEQNVDTWRSADPTSAEEVFVLEGLARGAGTFRLDSGLEVLREAWSIREKAAGEPGHSPLRYVQLARTEGLLYDQHRVRLESDAQTRLERAYEIARDNDYVRYVGVLEDMLAGP